MKRSSQIQQVDYYYLKLLLHQHRSLRIADKVSDMHLYVDKFRDLELGICIYVYNAEGRFKEQVIHFLMTTTFETCMVSEVTVK